MTIIGIDAGTSLIKAVAFDDEGREAASTTRPTIVRVPRPGWSEQDMPAVFDTVMAVVAQVAEQTTDPVRGLALTAQGDGLWLVDRDLAPTGPALLWNDIRGADIFDQWWREGAIAEVFGITGSVGGPGSPHALLAWLRAHDPARLAGAVALTCSGWLFARLTGAVVTERADSCSPFGEVLAGGWSSRALDAFSLGWAGPMLPPVVDGEDRIGALSREAATLAGLPAGLPVVIAPYDVVSTAHGAGALNPGDAAIILGTTLCPEVITPSPRLDRPPSGITLTAAVPGGWLVAQPGLIGTGVVEWAATLLGLSGAAALSDLAATADPAADRPLVLPYLAPGGERAPFYDPAVTGSVLGLRSWHQPADVARAVLEGLSLAAADGLAAAGTADRVMLAGGGQASALWCQLIAEACGVEVRQVPGSQPGARGAVMCARVLLGLEKDWGDLRRWLAPGTSWTPDPAQSAYWAQVRQRFRSAREHAQTP
jgi:erythritol kinase